MSVEVMNLKDLASYLRQDNRQLERMASRGKIPGRRVSGRWRFERAEILHWIETRLQTLTESELTALESSGELQTSADTELLVTPLLSIETIAVPLLGKTKGSVLRELVRTAERSGKLYQTDLIQDAVLVREQLCSTGLDCGAAIPHWRRPLPKTLSKSLIAYGRSTAGIPFGAPSGCLTDIFFLVLCRDDRAHLHVIARLARLLQNPQVLDSLRGSVDAVKTYDSIECAENALFDV